LVVPYLTFLPLYLIGLVAIKRIGVHSNNASPISIADLLNAVVVHPIGAYWFLHALIVMTFCFVIAKTVATLLNAGDPSILALFALSLAICSSIGILKSWVTAYYLAGMVLARGNMSIPASLSVGLVGMAGSVFFMQTQTTEMSLAGLAWCLSIISVLASLAQNRDGRLVDLVAWLGQNTLIILLCHAMFIVAMMPASGLFPGVHPSGILYALAVTALATTGCVIISVVLDVVGASLPLFGAERLYRPRRRFDDPGFHIRQNRFQ
jgi:fucose 4-O-acetylase-like acetyltransferase